MAELQQLLQLKRELRQRHRAENSCLQQWRLELERLLAENQQQSLTLRINLLPPMQNWRNSFSCVPAQFRTPRWPGCRHCRCPHRSCCA